MKTTNLCARVSAAAAMGGRQMYQVKVACAGRSTSTLKTRDDFKAVVSMFKLAGAMSRGACACCARVSAMTAAPLRGCDELALEEFLLAVLDSLRGEGAAAIAKCGAHRGVVQILMEFLSVRDGKYFCNCEDMEESEEEQPVVNQENDAEHPIKHCSLNRTLSQKFAAMDSVC